MRQRDASGRVTSSIVAVVSVLVITAALVAFMLGGSADDTTAASDTASPSPGSSSSRTASTGDDPDAEATEGDTTAPKKAPQHDEAEPKKKPKKKKAEPTPEPAPVVPEVYVEVYNMTSVSGLAGSTAARLQDAGWQVVGIDNWRGDIPASTVYYPDGMADEADQLADTLGIGRVRGAVAPMKFDRLTVILTADAT